MGASVLIFLGILLGAITSSAHSATLTATQDSQQNVTVRYSGPVEQGDLDKLRRLVNQYGYVTTIKLSSPGGLSYEGIDLGAFIRRHNIETTVGPEDTCFSACFDIFIGGVLRSVNPRGKLGSHMHALDHAEVFRALIQRYKPIKDTARIIRHVLSDIEQLASIITARRIRHMISMGVDYRSIDPLLETKFFAEYYFSQSELRRYNITNF